MEDENGISSFSLLQTDLKEGRDRFVYYVFDLLYLDGRDLTGAPLVERKAALAKLLKGSGKTGVIRYTDHFEEGGPLILKKACEMGLEGIISKRRDAPYRSGRTDNFIKTKCHGRQEFIVAGYTPSTALPKAIGALTVAVHENGELRYAGRVGTGYTQKMARDLFKRLDPLRTEPAADRVAGGRAAQGRRLGAAEARDRSRVCRRDPWRGAAAGLVQRHPRGQGSGGSRARSSQGARRRARKSRSSKSRRRPAASNAKQSTENRNRARASKNKDAAIAAVRLTHPDRVYWPDVGVTKKDLAEYYVDGWDWIKPHILGRALSLVRAPEGTGGETFFQKHIAANMKSSPLRRVVPGKDHDVIAVETVDDLVALVQSAALEIHVRGSRLDSLETCDRIVFDLDPGEGVAWPQIVAAARETRERLQALKLESFVKLSGGKGIHVMRADRRCRLGHRQAVCPTGRRSDGRRQSEALSRQNDEIAAQGPRLHRLFAQFARGDVGCGLFDARAARRAGFGAGDVGAAVAHHRRQRFFAARSEKAPQG